MYKFLFSILYFSYFNVALNLNRHLYDNFVTSWSSYLWDTFKQTSSSLLDKDSSNVLHEIEYLLFVEALLSFLLLKIPLDESFFTTSFRRVPSFDVESSKDRSTTEIVLSKEITGVNLFSHEVIDEVAEDSYRLELMPSSFSSWIHWFIFLMISSFLDFSWNS